MAKEKKTKNVQIPLDLFIDIVELLDYLNTDNWDITLKVLYDSILERVRTKQDSMALREFYAGVVRATDEDKQHDARMLYLQMKRIYKP